MNETHYRFTQFSDEIKARVEALLAQMTLEEKIGQMNQVTPHWLPDIEAQVRAGRVGSLLGILDPAAINRFQRVAVEESPHGIPLLVGNDVIHGLRTVFPIPLAEACTWDPALQERASRAAADEAAACGTNWIFAPMVDICRDPRWGRIAEGAGEDPFLGRAMARARVRGFQAKGLAGGRKIAACPKHYVAYGAAEAGRDYNTTDPSERTLRDLYLPPFKAAFDEGAGTVMSAFNEIGGVPATANPFTLKTVLREEWGLDDMLVLSDYNAVGELVPHGVAADLKEAALKAALAGVDMDMMSQAYIQHLADLVREGEVPESVVDAAVRRILGLKFALGLFDHPYVDESLAAQVILRPEHRALALEMAQKSMVLLKNDERPGGGRLLPLKATPASKIALIGPLADDRAAPLGCWAWMGRAEDVESVLDGLQALLPEGAQLEHMRGCAVWRDPFEEFDRAAAAAAAADVAVLVLGENAWMSGEARSRAHLGLPGRQRELLDRVVAAGKPTAVVLMSGRPLMLTPWIDKVDAVLQAWHGGIRAGRAVAEILLGQVNPSGKLSVTWPRGMGQIPIYYAHKNTGRPEQGAGTQQFEDPFWSKYIDESNDPLFPFGYGLSYTSFAYSDLKIEPPLVDLNGTLKVSAVVANTGPCAGDEVVQLYVRDLVGSVTRPVKELKGFQRIFLRPGERQTVHFELPVSELGFHGPDNRYVVEPGAFKVWIGPNSAEGLEGEFELR